MAQEGLEGPLASARGVASESEIYSVQGFARWLETQPADQSYDWYSIDDCATAQYLNAQSPTRDWRDISSGRTLGDVFPGCGVYWQICETRPWTLGAALERARAYLSTQSNEVTASQ